MSAIKIAIANDHKMFRNAVVHVLNLDADLQVVIEAENGRELFHKMESKRPDIVLIDFRMPDVDGSQALKIIREKYHDIKIIVLSQFSNDDDIITMYKLGVRSFLTNGDLDEMSRIVKIINQGGTFWTDEINAVIQNSVQKGHGALPFSLSKFEQSLIQELSKGKSCTELGEQFAKSPRTIEKYRADLYLKFGVENKEQLISVAAKYLLL